MKLILNLTIIIACFLFSSCVRETGTQAEDIKIVAIKVQDTNNSLISDAIVEVYSNEEDLNKRKYKITEKQTNDSGVANFSNLKHDEYYSFYSFKDSLKGSSTGVYLPGDNNFFSFVLYIK